MHGHARVRIAVERHHPELSRDAVARTLHDAAALVAQEDQPVPPTSPL